MKHHINIVAWLQIGFAILGILLAGLFFLFFGLAGSFADGQQEKQVLKIVAYAITGIVLLFSIPGLIAGAGLLKRRKWARILSIVLAVLNLLSFPIGTAIGIYSIWALSQPEVIEDFEHTIQEKNGL